MNPLIQYWYFHAPNFILAAMMYSLIGRMILGAFLAEDSRNYIFRAFARVSDPAVRAARFLAPAMLPMIVVMIFAVLWLVLARGALFIGLGNLGLLPGTEG